MKYAIGFLAAGFVAILLALGVMFTGVYNVAASEPHAGFSRWLLDRTVERSVAARATAPPVAPFTAAQARAGFRAFDRECTVCHGAPGVEPAGWADAMRPRPPDLSQAARRWTAPELHWIVKHGIKMSAMPAMGGHHEDEALWEIVAFLQTLPHTSPEQYRALREGGGSGGPKGSDSHEH